MLRIRGETLLYLDFLAFCSWQEKAEQEEMLAKMSVKAEMSYLDISGSTSSWLGPLDEDA